MYSLLQLKSICNGQIIQNGENQRIKHFFTDSRQAIISHDAVFVAIKGPNHDGHQFIPELYAAGLRNFIIEHCKMVHFEMMDKASFIQVESGLQALQEIAKAHRCQFSTKVIAITGSNGKTIVKEWLGQLLSPLFSLTKSPKSYNSQLGVPLSVLLLQEEHDLAIFEAGISQKGEMQKLSEIIQPSLGIFTNIGSAHDLGFENRTEKINEKLLLFKSVKKLIYCKDCAEIDKVIIQQKFPSFTWGSHADADVKIINQQIDKRSTWISLAYRSIQKEIKLPFADAANIENAMHCLAILLYLEIPLEDIEVAIQSLKNIDMRLEMVDGINNCRLIDDSYNNDIAGLRTGIDFMLQQNLGSPKTVILSDILQSGLEASVLYQMVSTLMKQKGIEKFIGIGTDLCKHSHCFAANSSFFESTDDFLNYFETDNFRDEDILIKGARPFAFERIVKRLQKKHHGTVLEVNLDALLHNLNFYRGRLQAGTKVMVMVKAMAYGAGGHQIASFLQYHRVDYLAVAYVDEGEELRKHGVSLPIMVLNVQSDQFEKIIQARLEPEIYSIDQLESLAGYLQENNQKTRIHLKVDTGMHRLGLELKDIAELMRILKAQTYINIASIFSHLSGADESIHDAYTIEQINKFELIFKTICNGIGYKPFKHILNSAGILRFPQYQYDMVRLGIGLYGYDSSQESQVKLRPVSTLKTTISQIRQIEAGATVGYGRKGSILTNSQIATIAIGYADGYLRAFGNGKMYVNINGNKALVVGNVCMDMTMVDVTGVSCKEGDEVIIFGEDPTIYDLARAIDTIPYEILTNIKDRVKRVYYSA
ncbi:MAG: bifunctional UDP-N-acetylmuramoyl-tripeptide:D-alanyl-D-alanine ligase/alanine racemase [Cyclobacteriaceae bacterium]